MTWYYDILVLNIIIIIIIIVLWGVLEFGFNDLQLW
jgi:hypothetical protein